MFDPDSIKSAGGVEEMVWPDGSRGCITVWCHGCEESCLVEGPWLSCTE